MKRPLQRAEKVLLASTVLLCLPALILGWIYQKQNELPPAPVPQKQIPPSPNAFDLVVAAAGRVKSAPMAMSSATGCTSSGIDIETSCGEWQPKPYTRAYNRAFPPRAKRVYLQANQGALKLWRQSLSVPLWTPEAPTLPSDGLWKSRSKLFPVLRTQARFCWQNGKPGESLDWLLLWHRDVCRSTRSFYGGKSQPAGIYRFVSAKYGRTSVLDELELLAPHLNAAQMQRAARQLQENRALLPSHVEALRVTKAANLDLARQVCESNDLRRYLDFRDPKQVEGSGAETLRFRWANKKAGLRKLADQWDWIIGQSQAPTPGYGQNMPESLVFGPSDVFSAMQTDSDYLKNPRTEIDAREVVFLTAMATRAFALEKRRNPRDLRELVPRYLHREEVDPYNHARPLIYLPQAKSYTISQRGGPITKRPLPKNAIPSFSGPPFDSLNPAGYARIVSRKTLPFLLYSVGSNHLDEGGLDFKTAKSGDPVGCDDILARSRWFSAQEQERDEHLARLSRFFLGPPPPP